MVELLSALFNLSYSCFLFTTVPLAGGVTVAGNTGSVVTFVAVQITFS